MWSSFLRNNIGPVVGSFERGNKYSNSVTDRNFVEGEGVLFFQQ